MKSFKASVAATMLFLAGFAAGSVSPAVANPPVLNCYPQLTTCGYPTTATVGPSPAVTLTPYTGVIDTSSPNQVIENLDIDGCIVVDEPGVIIRDVKLHGDCFFYVDVAETASATVERVEIKCNGSNTGVSGWNLSVDDSWIYRCENAASIVSDVSITDSILQALESTEEAHGDVIQGWPGSNVYIHHNLLAGYNPMTSSIITDPDGTTDWEISDNFMSAGAFTLYCPYVNVSDFVVTGNRFYPLGEDVGTREADPRSPAYGLTTDCDSSGITFSGNFVDNTGQTVNSDGSLS